MIKYMLKPKVQKAFASFECSLFKSVLVRSVHHLFSAPLLSICHCGADRCPIMSRLEQMRQHFLKRVYIEQQQSLPLSRLSLSCAKSIHHIPSFVKVSSALHSQLRRTSSGLQSIQNDHYHGNEYTFTDENGGKVAKTNMSRVKSLNNVYLMQPSRTKPKSVNNKQTSETKRNSTSSVNSNATIANNAKVNRPTRPGNWSRVLPAEHKRTTVNNTNRNELQCKHCDRKFASKERLDKHVDICARTFLKQRPVFNSSKQRLKEHLEGEKTEHIDNKSEQTAQGSSPPAKTSQTNGSETINETNARFSNWKETRQHFLKAIKEAKLKRVTKLTSEISECDPNPNPNDTLVNSEGNFMCCSYCKRIFGMNVIIKHEIICGKLYRKKHFNV